MRYILPSIKLFVVALFWVFLINTIPRIAIWLALVMFLPRRMWGMELKLGKGSTGHTNYTIKGKKKRLYLLGGVLVALLATIMIIGSSDDTDQNEVDTFCKALGSKLSVDCSQTLDQDDDDDD